LVNGKVFFEEISEADCKNKNDSKELHLANLCLLDLPCNVNDKKIKMLQGGIANGTTGTFRQPF
jgi:hypothetical protein